MRYPAQYATLLRPTALNQLHEYAFIVTVAELPFAVMSVPVMTTALAPSLIASFAAFCLANATFLSTVKLKISVPDTTSMSLQLSAALASITFTGNDADELDEHAVINATENRIAIERKSFNQSVTSYNNTIIVFPKNIISNIFGFDKRAYFKSEDGAKVAPKIKMTSDK